MTEPKPQDLARDAAAESLSQLAESGREIPGSSREPLPEGNQNPLVMVVDDDEGFRSMIRSWLADEGLQVVADAPDGPEAVTRAAETHPDVILMDLRMPKMDGIEAASRILASDPSAQVILLSAYGDASLKHAAAEAGVYCYLLKDGPPDVLWRTIRFAWMYKLSLQNRGQAAANS